MSEICSTISKIRSHESDFKTRIFYVTVGGGTPVSEARLEQKRRVLRRALKHEYMNQRYNPEMYMQGRRVFDTAFHR